MIDSPISEWFELSYAQFLTVPRLVMQSMPLEWQQKMAELLHEMDETFDWRPQEGRYWVKLKDNKGRYTDAPLSDYRRGNIEHLRKKVVNGDFINDEGNWECRHCGAKALLRGWHLPDCPIIREQELI